MIDGVGVGMSGSDVDPTSGDLIRGNIIGLDATATRRLGNALNGVRLFLATDATVGGTALGSGNVISGNGAGVDVLGLPGLPLGDLIQGNVIGLGGDGRQLESNVPGLPALGNIGNGVVLERGAAGVTLGGTTLDAGNEISGNGSVGVRFLSAASNDLVEGNRIGVAADGLAPRANNESGVFLAEQATGITIGGTTPGSANVISGNATGVTITNSGTSGDLVEGNVIGLGLDGSSVVGNLGYGVLLLDGASGDVIGGDSPGSRNVISGNGQGVGLIGPGSNGNLVAGNLVGLDATGSQPRGNLQLGIFLTSASDNTIGGLAFASGNVVSANTGVGIEVFGPGSTGNLVAGNLVGLDASGSRIASPFGEALGNAGYGVQVQDAPGNTIGGTTPGRGNVISGNRQGGVDVLGPGSGDTFLQGNLIGTDAGGSIPLGNLADGVLVDNAPFVVIGGAGASARNVISGNAASGVEVDGQGSMFDLVLADFIGTDQYGLAALGNGQSGVYVNDAPGVVVGGSSPLLRDVISANRRDGVRVAGAGSVDTQVLGDYVGVDATGLAPLGNLNDGILIDGALGITLGGEDPGSADVISANLAAGVELGGQGSSFNRLLGNLIGTDATGSFSLGNGTDGVLVNSSSLNVIGGASPADSNLISGNADLGVHLLGGNSMDNNVQGNRIGTDASGMFAIANTAGVFLDGAPRNLILGDLLSGNVSAGLVIQGTGATGNFVEGNLVGLDLSGTRAVTGPSVQQSGLLIVDAPGNTIGGTTPSARNVFSGDLVGVVISGFNARGNLVEGNFLGTGVDGRAAASNQAGVYINGSPSNTIGGSVDGAGNLISGNTATGVDLYGTLTSGNLVQGNRIGTDVTGTVAVPNGTGVYAELATSNTIGGPTPAAGDLISGNSVAGVYFYNQASGNLVQEDRIGVSSTGKPLGNLEYGVLLYNAANNTIDKSKATGSVIANSGIGNFREFTGAAPASTTTTTATAKSQVVKIKAVHPIGPGRVVNRR